MPQTVSRSLALKFPNCPLPSIPVRRRGIARKPESAWARFTVGLGRKLRAMTMTKRNPSDLGYIEDRWEKDDGTP